MTPGEIGVQIAKRNIQRTERFRNRKQETN